MRRIIYILPLLFLSSITFAEENELNLGGLFAYGGSSFIMSNIYVRYPISGRFGIGSDIYYVQQKLSPTQTILKSYAVTPYLTLDLLRETEITIEGIAGIGFSQSFYEGGNTTAVFSPNVGIGGRIPIFSNVSIEANGIFFIYQDGSAIFSTGRIRYGIGNGIGIVGGIQGLNNIVSGGENSFNIGGMLGIIYEL